MEGLEPPTPGFGDRCSSQLSYTPNAALLIAGKAPVVTCFRTSRTGHSLSSVSSVRRRHVERPAAWRQCDTRLTAGESATTILKGTDRIDLLFTDIRLPGALDGWEVARVGRRARSALPIIYATGYTVDRTAEVGGAIFLNKPYQPSQIIETIRKLLG